jgi:hypothetical protein
MKQYLTIGRHSHEARHLRKTIKKWVKRGWAEKSVYYTPDEHVYEMKMPFYVTEDNKLKVDYDKLFTSELILWDRNPRHAVVGDRK